MSHVLVIQGDYDIATQIADLIETLGAPKVVLAASQAAAMAVAQVQKPVLIVSDVDLARGNGRDAVRDIISMWGAIPVIFITPSPDECDLDLNAAAILTKPFAPHMFLESVQALSIQ